MYCHRCKTTTGPFYKSTTYKRKDGTVIRYHKCRKCNTELARAWRATENGKLTARREVAKYEARNREKKLAWNAVMNSPKKPCLVCGVKEPVHRHHPDYNKPNEVIFLCALHHKQLHKGTLQYIM